MSEYNRPFSKIKLAFYTEENAYDILDGLRDSLEYMEYGYTTVWKLYRLADMPTSYIMRSWGWYDIEDATIERDGDDWVLTMPPAELIEEVEQSKEMNKPTMDLKNSLYTSTSTATVNWQDNTFTLANPSITVDHCGGYPSNITISGDTIGGLVDWAAHNTDYTTYFNRACNGIEDYIRKEEINVNTVAKRNGKAVDAATNFKKIEVYNDRVVKITFADGTYTKAVCSDADEFCLDTGIMVCVMKKLFGGQKEGTKLIASMLNNAHAQIEKQENEKIEAELKAVAEKQKKRKAELKEVAKAMKAKEEAIDIQKQAYIRAMQEMGMTKDE